MEKGLNPLPVAERGGVIFVLPKTGVDFDLDAYLGDVAPELETWNLKDLHFVKCEPMNAPANWKLTLDTFSEGYHPGFLHKETFAPFTHMSVIYYLFPSTVIVLTEFNVGMFRVYPDGIGRSHCFASEYVWDPVTDEAEQQAANDGYYMLKNVVQDEDFTCALSAQKGFESGAVDKIIYGKNEPSLIAMHEQYRDALNNNKNAAE